MKKGKWALILNISILILEIIGFAVGLYKHGLIIMGFYTQLSNLVLLIASGLYVGTNITRKHISREVALWKYVATCLVTVTFVTVFFVFVPMCLPSVENALYVVLDGASLYHHVLCPLLAMISFFAFENDIIPGIKEAVVAMLPTLMYAIVSTSLNIAKIVEGPYPFLYVYKQPIIVSVLWFIAIPGFGFVFALFVGKIKARQRN